MGKRKEIFYIIPAVFVILLFAACDVLIAPIKARLNPNDTENPIPAAVDFTATLNEDNPSNRIVQLAWADGDGGDGSLEGYVLVRKAGSAPASVYDGDVVTLVQGSISADDGEVEADGYPRGARVYYSIFSYGPKWTDLSSDEQLYYEATDGALYNSENYYFVGPVSTSLIVTDTVTLSASESGSIFNPSGTQSDPIVVSEDMASILQAIGFITFNLNDISSSDFKVTSASLTLTTTDTVDATMGHMEIQMMIYAWSGETWDNVSAAGAINSNYSIVTYPPSSTQTEFVQDVTQIVSLWASGAYGNYGLRLYPFNDSAATFDYLLDFYGGTAPNLTVTYYKD